MKSVFVTVGTTSFDELIQTVSNERIHKILYDQGYRKLTIQTGSCQVETNLVSKLFVNTYQYKNSIAEDIKDASLVISHAGAGSIMEALKSRCRLVVIVNEQLMNNHQVELAEQLQKDSHLLYGTCRELENLLREIDCVELKAYEPGDPQLFANFLDSVMAI